MTRNHQKINRRTRKTRLMGQICKICKKKDDLLFSTHSFTNSTPSPKENPFLTTGSSCVHTFGRAEGKLREE